MAPKNEKVDPKAAAKAAAQAAKEAAANKKAEEAAALKDAAEKKAAKEKEAAEKKVAKERAAADKKAAKEAEKAEKAEGREAEKAQREALKGGPGKRLRSLIARIKYMIYMDNPSAGIDDIELLTWTLTLTLTDGTLITVTRGETTATVIFTIGVGKKAETVECAATQEALEEVVGKFTP